MLTETPPDTWSDLFNPPRAYAFFERREGCVLQPGAAPHQNACWLVDASVLAYGQTRDGAEPAPANQFGIPTVHAGFRRALDHVWREVSAALREYRAAHPGCPVFLTGHSRGGALALLSAARFDDPDSFVYTFGAPKPGNLAYCQGAAGRLSGRVHQYIHAHDIVPLLPPSSFGYVRFDADTIYLPDGVKPSVAEDSLTGVLGELRQCFGEALGLAVPAALRDHSIHWYLFEVWKQALTVHSGSAARAAAMPLTSAPCTVPTCPDGAIASPAK